MKHAYRRKLSFLLTTAANMWHFLNFCLYCGEQNVQFFQRTSYIVIFNYKYCHYKHFVGKNNNYHFDQMLNYGFKARAKENKI